jgi:surface antigen
MQKIYVRRAALAFVSSAALLANSACATAGAGQNEAIGGVLGALGGAVAGGLIGEAIGDDSGRLVGALIGAGVGAYFGRNIARNLSERDQAAMQAETARVLTEAPDGGRSVVTLPESGKSLAITTSETEYQPQDFTIARVSGVDAPPSGFEVINQAYRTDAALNLRSSPEVTDNRIGVMPEGQAVNVLGRVRGGDWMILTRADGAIIGYASGAFMSPAVERPTESPRVERASAVADTQGVDLDSAGGGIDLDSPSVTQVTAVDLDALGATTERTQAATACRTVTYNLDAMEESGRVCRNPSGVWEIA